MYYINCIYTIIYNIKYYKQSIYKIKYINEINIIFFLNKHKFKKITRYNDNGQYHCHRVYTGCVAHQLSGKGVYN